MSAQEGGRLVDRQRADLGDGPAAHRHGQADRLEAAALARGARDLAHEALETLAAGVGLGLAVPALDVAAHPLELGVVGALPAVAVGGDDVHLGRVAVEQRLARLGRQLLPGGVQVEAELLTQRTHQPEEVVGDMGLAPRLDGTLAEGGLGVGHHEVGVDLHPGAEAVALGARAERGVERERPWLELVGVDRVVVGARHLLGELQLAARVLRRQVDEVEDDQAAGQAQRGLHGVGQAALGRRLHGEPVDDHLDGVLLLLVELGGVVERVGLAVDADPREPVGLQLPEELDVLALAAADHRGEHLEPPPLLEGEHAVDDLLGRLPLDRARRRRGSAAGRRARRAGAGSRRPR